MIFSETDWGWLTNQGLAVGLLIAIGLGVWRICSWTGTNVVIPMKDSAITHLQETNKAMKSNAEATAALTEAMGNLHGDVKDIRTRLELCQYRRINQEERERHHADDVSQ